MVYRIGPFACHLNYEIDLEYEQSPAAQGGWFDFVMNEKPIPKEHAPTLILSKRATPLPDAFEISRHFWCVSARVREAMEKLFGSQVAFYEVPVVVKATNVSLPSTQFVTFSQFCSSIDWQKSKVRARRLPSAPDIEVVDLADVGRAAVFKATPNDREMIWIERRLRQGNRFFRPWIRRLHHERRGPIDVASISRKFHSLTEFEEIPARSGSTAVK